MESDYIEEKIKGRGHEHDQLVQEIEDMKAEVQEYKEKFVNGLKYKEKVMDLINHWVLDENGDLTHD